MKVFALLAAATIATVSAADCDLGALAPVASSPEAIQCGLDAEGYSVISAKFPTDTQLPKMCLSKDCNALLALLKKAAPTECSVSIAQPPVDLYAKLLTPIETACEKIKKEAGGGATTAPATTTTAPATTTTAPTATTVAPATTTVAPAATTAAPAATTEAPKEAGSGSAPLDEIQSPAEPNATASNANATTPAPVATQSSASSVIAAAGAVVVAVAASLF